MNSFIKRALGIIFAEQKGDMINLFGIKTGLLRRDIMRTWSTSRIEGNIFQKMTPSMISFNAFFAPDVHYMLQELLHKGSKDYVSSSKRHIRAAIAALQENTWLSRLNDSEFKSKLDRSKLALFHKAPLPHQDQFFEVYDRNTQRYGLHGYLLSARAGSGKTLTDLMLAEMVGSDYIVLVVPKNSIDRVWTKTLKEEFKTPPSYWTTSSDKPYSGERYLLTHYEALEKVLQVTGKLHGKVAVVLDESHNFNDIGSQRTQNFIKLCNSVKSENVIWASGTPVKAMGYEVIPMLKTIDPMFSSDVETRFKRIFGKEAKRALDILRNRMGMISYRVEKIAELDSETPSEINVKVKIPDGQKYTLTSIRDEMRKFIDERLKFYRSGMRTYEKRYDEILEIFKRKMSSDSEVMKDFSKYQSYIKTIRRGYDPGAHKDIAAFCNNFETKVIMPALEKVDRDDFKNIRSIIKYVDLKVMGEALGGVLGRKRAEVHRKMIPEAHLERYVDDAITKTLIFTSYVSVVQDLNEYFKKHDYTPIMVYGDTNNQLDSMLTRFEKDEKLNPAIATYMSLSTAVPMTMASTAIFMNAPFREHEMIQAKARINRLGQKAHVTYVHVFLDTGNEPNISTRANDILEWSKQQIAAIMGDENADMSGALESYYSLGMEEHFIPTAHPFIAAFESVENELFEGF